MITILNTPLPSNQYSIKAPYVMKPIGVTIHETDNEAPAVNEIAYMQRNTNRVSFHYAVDNKNIIQGLPLDRNSWNAGDGTNGRGNRQTISIEICGNYRRKGNNVGQPTDWYEDARANAEKLTGYLLYVNGWTDKDIYTHNDWSGKNCPRVIRRQGYMPTFKKNAMAWKAKFAAAAGKPSTPTPSKKTNAQLAQEVLQGKWGNGADRRNRLTAAGYNYTAVQNEVDKLLNIKPSAPATKPKRKTNAELAREVIQGKWGNGAERKNRLEKEGYNYNAVQAEVEKQLGNKPSTPSKPKLKSNAEIAKEVIRGDWGNGADRRNRLTKAGYNYTAVQNEVDKQLKGSTSKPKLKPISVIAREVIAGDWGNGADRKRRLESAGYNYDSVQKEVNKQLK